jgi:hypothetical protein
MASTNSIPAPALPPVVAITAAWLVGLTMILLATSLAGIFAAPLAVPAAVVAARRSSRWSVRVPLVLGAVALTLLMVAWLFGGASLGGTTSGGSSA